MAHLTSNFSFPLPPLIIQPLPIQEPAAKRRHFEEYEDSSPSHSESESSRSSNSAPESRASLHEDENVHEPLTVSTDTPPTISLDAKFESYKQFEEVFEAWKKEQFHPFRVASSETLKESDGTVNPVFKYRYVVYHCAHYGEPRMRGIGKRPNQTYLPCGCRAMLRVNYSFPERILKITTLVDVHTGHEQNADIYHKAMTKTRGSLSPAGIPAKRAKRDHDSTYSSSPLSMRNSPINSTAASVQSSPASTVSPASMAIQHALLMQQQQQSNLMAALMSQQKENQMNPALTTQQLQYALHSLQQRPQLNQNPAILTMINQLSIPLFNLPQPAHAVVAPQPAVDMKTHTEQANELIDVVNEFNLPANLPAPKPIKRGDSPPPVLERVDLETLKPAVLNIKTEVDTETESQLKMKTVLDEMTSRIPSLSSEQLTTLLPQLEMMLALFKQ